MIKKVLIFLSLVGSGISFAQTHLPAFFSNNMVLQQNEMVSVWGTDNPGRTITLSGSWGKEATATSDESGKWKTKISTPSAGGPYNLIIKGSEEITIRNVLIGEVWLCSGQSNMYMPVKGFRNQPVNGSKEAILQSMNDQIRLFHTEKKASLEPLDDVTGKWQAASPMSVREFSAAAYFFGNKLYSILNVPIGLIHTSWSGSTAEAWTDEETLAEFKTISIPESIPELNVHESPTLMYNGMIHPFIGYSIKGVIWYQGESNRNRAEEYKSLFPAMIESWRAKWDQGSFPFYFVQIAPYNYGNKNSASSAFLREAQLYTMQSLNNTGMAVTLDIGDCKVIHPREKKIVGDRLAYWALANCYDFQGIAFSGPVYREITENSEGTMTLAFDYCENGLTGFGGHLTGFVIAGDDKVFHEAQVKINREGTLTVWSEEVKNPVAVRYAFKNCVKGTLFNTEGLPASSFRTDSWDQ